MDPDRGQARGVTNHKERLPAPSPRPRAAADGPRGFTFGRLLPILGAFPPAGDSREAHKFTQRARGIVQAIAVTLALALPEAIGDLAGRRPGRRRLQLGLAGLADVFRAAQHIDRAGRGATVQPHHHPAGQPGLGSPAGGGFFNRPGRGMLGGLAAGFLGAGLFGMLFGGGMFSGIGGFSSISA